MKGNRAIFFKSKHNLLALLKTGESNSELSCPKMPLVVMDYVWTQTETTLYINVPLKGTNAGKVDIVCTDDYLKVKF